MAEKPHSAEHFTDSRDLWWHADYLDLLARRFALDACRSMLDLGAGVGHWTALMMARCAPGARVTAVDREPQWVDALRRRFADRAGFEAIQADAADLSALAGPYDLVTSQTLLLHVPDVPAVLAEARRLLAPGGLLLLAEPDNFANRMQLGSSTLELSAAQYGALAAFWWAFERGRVKAGLGQESIAVLLPRLIVEAGFTGLATFVNDRNWAWFPPYDTPEQALQLRELAAHGGGDDEERMRTRQCAIAGGLDDAAFETGWALIKDLERRDAEARRARRYSTAGVGSHFVFAARKPR